MKAEAVLVALGNPYIFFSFLSYLVHWVVLQKKNTHTSSESSICPAVICQTTAAFQVLCHHHPLWVFGSQLSFLGSGNWLPDEVHQVHRPPADVLKRMPPGICFMHIPGGLRSRGNINSCLCSSGAGCLFLVQTASSLMMPAR